MMAIRRQVYRQDQSISAGLQSKRTEEQTDAIKEGKIEKGSQPEYQGTGTQRTQAEPSSSDISKESGQVPTEVKTEGTPEVVPQTETLKTTTDEKSKSESGEETQTKEVTEKPTEVAGIERAGVYSKAYSPALQENLLTV